MSRSKRFLTGLLSSYAAIGVNILYTLASVPLALHYLDKEEFGLWALVTQLSGYLMLLEFGMTGSVARTLADHKDDMENGTYGSVLRTGARVFAIQGLLVVVLGLAMAGFAPSLLDLPAHLHHPFTILMAAQSILSGLRLSLGALGSPLWCHQRLDLSNLSSSISMATSFAVLWMGFHLGWEVYSLIIATLAGSILGASSIYACCRRLGYYPRREHRGSYDPRIFRELFHFGGGLFLMNLGAQLTSASQVIVVSRLLGMEAAATWSVSTKIFTMAQQFVARVLDSSAGGLAEMVVRNEVSKLQKRFRDLVAISAVMAVAASAAIALMNGAFIELWTSGKVQWAPGNDLLLAAALFITSLTRCHVSLAGITKQIQGMKFAYLIEGIAFVLLSVLLVPFLGMAGLLTSAIACNSAITGAYAIKRAALYLNLSTVVVIRWIAHPAAVLAFSFALFALTHIPILTTISPSLRLFIGLSFLCFAVMPAMWRFGINKDLRAELIRLATNIVRKDKSKAIPT